MFFKIGYIIIWCPVPFNKWQFVNHHSNATKLTVAVDRLDIAMTPPQLTTDNSNFVEWKHYREGHYCLNNMGI